MSKLNLHELEDYFNFIRANFKNGQYDDCISDLKGLLGDMIEKDIEVNGNKKGAIK